MDKIILGKVVQVMGPVVDVRFNEGELPEILNALTIPIGDRTLTVEEAEKTGAKILKSLEAHLGITLRA